MTHLTDPTNLPAGDRRPTLVKLPAPAAPDLFVSEDGRRWRLAGADANGRLFVPELVDPGKCPRWVWAREADLAETVGALTPMGAAA